MCVYIYIYIYIYIYVDCMCYIHTQQQNVTELIQLTKCFKPKSLLCLLKN